MCTKILDSWPPGSGQVLIFTPAYSGLCELLKIGHWLINHSASFPCVQLSLRTSILFVVCPVALYIMTRNGMCNNLLINAYITPVV